MTVNKAPRIEDVARIAGVSTATVSRCLNNPDSVRASTRLTVEAAIEETGYTPHFGGRALAMNRTHTIGAVIPTMENAIFARGLQAVQERLSDSGTTLLLACSSYDPEREASQIRTLIQRGVDGLLLIGEARPESSYELLKMRNIPVVLVWCNGETTDHLCIGFDNREAARRMALAVCDYGHRDIAMVAGITSWNDRAARRVEGVREALESVGLTLDETNLIEADYTLEAGAQALRKLMNGSNRPTAVICGNDVLAAGVLQAAKQIGLRVPEELSITGFDDIELASVMDPALTTVHVPHRRMGWTAADKLLEMQSGSADGSNVSFATDLIIRSSLARKS
ncbi:LacI family DNA-binding transcriptional regulator [Nisaea sp.]|uniref:LacI family DNA-binding transcriptional regulator n=1 Tax=Nisaea sp. TaxID=2024842 RepID=UPI0032970298